MVVAVVIVVYIVIVIVVIFVVVPSKIPIWYVNIEAKKLG